MTMVVRPALPDEAATLADLAARTFPLACPPELPREAIEEFITEHLDVDAFRGYLNTDGYTVLASVRADGEVCAYALLVDGAAMDPACAHLLAGDPTIGISKFYVDQSLHGSGAARILLDAVIDHGRLADARSLWLATNVGNARARAFYTRSGFVERGTRVFTVGGLDNQDVVLELPL